MIWGLETSRDLAHLLLTAAPWLPHTASEVWRGQIGGCLTGAGTRLRDTDSHSVGGAQ